MGHAVELLRLPTPELQAKVADKIEKKGISVMETRDLVSKLLAKVTAKEDPAGQKAVPASASFKFSSKGDGFTVTAFSPDAANFDKFLEDLRGAYAAWTAKRVKKAKVAATTDPKAPSSKRFPTTPQEQAELEAIADAATGPGPVYAWICGPESDMTKYVAAMSWQDIGAKDGKDGLAQILEAMKVAKEQGL